MNVRKVKRELKITFLATNFKGISITILREMISKVEHLF